MNVSRKINSEFQAITNSTINVHVFTNNSYKETMHFVRKDLTTYSRFTCTYKCENAGYYYFNVTLVDNYFPNGLILFEHEVEIELGGLIDPIPPPDPSPIPNPVPNPIDLPFDLDGIKLAIFASILTAFVVLGVIWIGRKIKFRIQTGENRDILEKIMTLDQLEVRKNREQVLFGDWD